MTRWPAVYRYICNLFDWWSVECCR